VDKKAAAGSVVGSLDRKTYLVRYSRNGAKRSIPLGRCAAISLADARRAARRILGRVAAGEDPAAERARSKQASRDEPTLDQDIARWAAIGLKDRSAKYRVDAPRTLRVNLGSRLRRPTNALDRKTVVAAKDALIAAGTPTAARSFALHGSALFSWLIRRGAHQGANPFAKLDLPTTTRRDRVLSDPELRAVWRACEGMGDFGAVVRLLALTGQRRDEIAGMRWEELAHDRATLTLPSERVKNRVSHAVPLSRQARAIIEAQPRETPFVFPGPSGTEPIASFSRPKQALDLKSGVSSWRLHDLRRTCSTGLQRLGTRLEVNSATLNHRSGAKSGLAGIYQRYAWAAEMRAALQAWADHVDAIVAGREIKGAVTTFPLRAG
jgi:integrase